MKELKVCGGVWVEVSSNSDIENIVVIREKFKPDEIKIYLKNFHHAKNVSRADFLDVEYALADKKNRTIGKLLMLHNGPGISDLQELQFTKKELNKDSWLYPMIIKFQNDLTKNRNKK